MTTFDCVCCNYKTERRFDFSKHLRTKKHKQKADSMENHTITEKTTFCPPVHLQNPPKSSKNDEKSLFCPPIHLQFPPKSSDFLQKNVEKRPFLKLCRNNLQNQENFDDFDKKNDNFSEFSETDELICEYCDRRFTRIDNYNRHISKRCKIKRKIDVEDRIIIEKYKKDKELMLEIHEREKEEYKKHIEKLINKVGTTNITHNTNTNCGNTQTNNVQLNNFGQENLAMLTEKYMNKMISFPYSAIPKMIKNIHFNDKYPENRNIRMLNKKDNKLQIRNNGEWQYVNKRDTIQLLIEDKNYQLDKYFEENRNKFNDMKQKSFEKFQEKINIEDKKVINDTRQNTELVFWNSM